MKDLLAIATVRRVLMELGYTLQPEAPGGLVGPISLWIAEPRPDLDGLSPLQVLQLPDGMDRVRACLDAMLAARATPDPSRSNSESAKP